MDKHLNNNEERLFDLLDQKDFEQLTAEEKAFVETHFSQEEYRLQRQMIGESASLYEETPDAPPLVIPIPAVKPSFLGTTIPLYQALIGIAATVALFLSIWPNEPETTNNSGNKPALSKTDTIIQTQIIHDTVIRYKNYRSGNQAPSAAAKTDDEQFLAAQMRLLEANTVELPDLVLEMNRPTGNSLSNDPASERLLKSTYQSDAR